MIDASILSTLAGVTTVIGVVCVLAYLFILRSPEVTNLSITDVLGHRHDPVALNELLKVFPTEEGKLKALRARLNFDRNQAVDLLAKLHSNVSVGGLNDRGAKSRDKRFLISACLFFALGLIALISQLIVSGGGNGTGAGPAPSSASAPIATAPASSGLVPVGPVPGEPPPVSAGVSHPVLPPPPVPASADESQALEMRRATQVTAGPDGATRYTLQNGDVLTVYPVQKDGSQIKIRESPADGAPSNQAKDSVEAAGSAALK